MICFERSGWNEETLELLSSPSSILMDHRNKLEIVKVDVSVEKEAAKVSVGEYFSLL
jgi:hypothetical protein